MNYWILFAQIVAILFLVYLYFQRKYSYWSSRGTTGPPPMLPLGNVWEFIRIGQVKLEPAWLSKYGKVYGTYMGTAPVLTIADVGLIKQVLVKDFQSFINRAVNLFDHEIWCNNLFSSEDEQWRRIRTITSPAFSTGKLKAMQEMNRCVDKLVNHLDWVISEKDGKMNAKEVLTGFTLDVIASTSYATETNANQQTKGEKNAFLDNATKLVSINPFYITSFFLMPKWFNKLIGNEFASNPRSFNFFFKLSKEIIRQRKGMDFSKSTKQNDMVQLMLDSYVYENDLNSKSYDKLEATEADEVQQEERFLQNSHQNSAKKYLTENELIAQCILFFIAGFETTSNTLANCLYHLALYPEVQERLSLELAQNLNGLDVDSIEYLEKVNRQIPYLEAVIKETLRICPAVSRLQRRVGVDGYKLAGIPLTKDVEVNIATYVFHMSPEYYPETDKFNPTRFMPENKHLLIPYTYLPFGAGPRNCIGMRFAYQELKLCIASIVRQFQFATTPETKIPLNYAKFGGFMVKNVPLKVSRRVTEQ